MKAKAVPTKGDGRRANTRAGQHIEADSEGETVSGPDTDRLSALDADGASMLDGHFRANQDHALVRDAYVQQQAARLARSVLDATSPRDLAERLARGVDQMQRLAGDDPRLAGQLQELRALAAAGDPHAIVNAMTAVLDRSAHYMRRLGERRAPPINPALARVARPAAR